MNNIGLKPVHKYKWCDNVPTIGSGKVKQEQKQQKNLNRYVYWTCIFITVNPYNPYIQRILMQ